MSSATKPRSNAVTSAGGTAVQKLAKLLAEANPDPRQIRWQAIQQLIYPPRLAQRRIAHYGWLAALPVQGVTPEMRRQIKAAVANIEARTDLTPYERVGQITEQIKTITGRRFIADSAFREMMNTKFNEYILRDHADEIQGVDDVIRLLKEHAVDAKPTTLLAAFPEAFNRARPFLNSYLCDGKSTITQFGGQVAESQLEMAAAILQAHADVEFQRLPPLGKRDSMRTERSRATAAEQLANNVMRISALYPDLDVGHRDNPASACDSIKQLLPVALEAMKSQAPLRGFAHKRNIVRGMKNAAAIYTSDNDRQALEYIGKEWRADVDATRERIQQAVDRIKQWGVESDNSFDAMLGATAAYDYRTRQPLVFALNRILGLDPALPARVYAKECTRYLLASVATLFPGSVDKLEPNELWREASAACIDRYADMHYPRRKKNATPSEINAPRIDYWHLKEGTHSPILPFGQPRLAAKDVIADLPRETIPPHAFNVGASELRGVVLQYGAARIDIRNEKYLAKKKKPRKNMDIAKILYNFDHGDPQLLRIFKRADILKSLEESGQITSLISELAHELRLRDPLGNPVMHEIVRLLPSGDCSIETYKAALDGGARIAETCYYNIPLNELIRNSANYEEINRITKASMAANEIHDAIRLDSPLSAAIAEAKAASAPRRGQGMAL